MVRNPCSLPFLLRLPPLPQLLADFSTWLSDFSYTLYLAHFPLAAFLWYTLCDAQRLGPSPTAFGRFLTLTLVLVGYSFAMSLLFERNTDRLRRYIMGVITGSKPNQSLAPSRVAGAVPTPGEPRR